MGKKPKIANEPTNEKVVKTSPIHLNKTMYASWQTNKIDLLGVWGLDALGILHFSIGNDILDELGNEVSEELLSSLVEMDKKKFNSFDDFLFKLCRTPVTTDQLKVIFKALSSNVFWSEVYPKLKDYERKTWFEIEQEKFGKNSKTKHHFVSIGDMIPLAQKRLRELDLDEYDSLFSLRLTGTIRIWGIREQGYMKIIWFDLNHAICPTSKD